MLLFAGVGMAQKAEQSPQPDTVGTNITDTHQNESLLLAHKPKISALKQLYTIQLSGTYVRPSSKTRFKRYVNDAVGPFALAGQIAGAGFSTWINSPQEWGEKWEGFGRRVASNVGTNIIRQTAIYGLDEAFKLDSHFYRSEKRDIGSRLRNALISPVTARNRNGKRIIGLPRIAGTYGAAIIAVEAWYPGRYDYREGLKNGTISLGVNAAFNLFKEFIFKK